jgi:hypothetical protein
VQDDGREERGRRARRAVWAFRLAFYGGAAAVALALIAARGSGGGPTPWVGATVDGTPVSIEPGHDGRARGIDLQVTATCPWTGETWPARWWVDADRVPFERHGDRIHVYESWTERFRNGTVALNEFTIDL